MPKGPTIRMRLLSGALSGALLSGAAAAAPPDGSADAWRAAAPAAGSVAVYRDDWGVPQWQAALGAALGARPKLSPSERRLAQRILRFDGLAAKRSVAAFGFHYWHDGVAEAARSHGAAGAGLAQRAETSVALDEAQRGLLLEGLRLAAARLDRLAQWDTTYGEVFRVGRGGRTYRLGGCATPFTVSLHTYYCGPGDRERRAIDGQKSIMLTIFGRPLRSYSLSAFGQDRRAGSRGPHVDDQSKLASEGRLKPTYFDYPELVAATRSKLVLKR